MYVSRFPKEKNCVRFSAPDMERWKDDYLYEKYMVDNAKGKVNKEWLAKAVEKFRKDKNEVVHAAPDVSHTFQNRFQQFLDASDLKQTRVNQYRVIERAVLRFEAFVRMTKSRSKQYVFVFHCCIGCRVGDLLRLTKGDIINGAIEYIPTKTISDNAKTVRVPLNGTALSIIEKYKDYSETKLLPFISSQKYNDYIKVVIEKCGITRQVTVLNSITRKEEKVPIYTVASSHMARRTFIANIYNKVQDPNLIGSMTGHVEGSRAFARYRTIDESVKKNMVDILG